MFTVVLYTLTCHSRTFYSLEGRAPFVQSSTKVLLFNTKAEAWDYHKATTKEDLDRSVKTPKFLERFTRYHLEPWLSTKELFSSDLWKSLSEDEKFFSCSDSKSFDFCEANWPTLTR